MLDSNQSKVMLPRLVLRIFVAFACATAGYGQAAVEYALQSSGGAVSASASNPIIAGCRVDSTLLTCLSRSYPKTTIVVVALLTVMIFRWLTRGYRTQS
jgi:hypothetical protein